MTKKYKILFNKQYLKDFVKIPLKAQNQIRQETAELSFNPRPEGSKNFMDRKRIPYTELDAEIIELYIRFKTRLYLSSSLKLDIDEKSIDKGS